MRRTTVVFDLGNVLVGWDPNRVWSPTMTPEQIASFVDDVDFGPLNRSLDAGRRYADVRAEVAERWPEHVGTLDLYWNGFAESLTGPIPGTEAVVQELKGAGIRLLGLTNWSAETIHLAPGSAPAVALLEDLVVSGRELLAKPDPAIFRILIDRFDLVPEETFFTDDSLANVESARSLGMLAHQFRDAASLRTELRDHGLPV